MTIATWKPGSPRTTGGPGSKEPLRREGPARPAADPTEIGDDGTPSDRGDGDAPQFRDVGEGREGDEDRRRVMPAMNRWMTKEEDFVLGTGLPWTLVGEATPPPPPTTFRPGQHALTKGPRPSEPGNPFSVKRERFTHRSRAGVRAARPRIPAHHGTDRKAEGTRRLPRLLVRAVGMPRRRDQGDQRGRLTPREDAGLRTGGDVLKRWKRGDVSLRRRPSCVDLHRTD